ncbi:PKD domain-containing protein [Neobacillus sp. WH10]|uniref:OmpL47-type beta-barrel domain-containing protein n=1 Tax=Neobacillus sp. WH10 TaxID=3047873 RepID=UPI0024C0EAC2|nr:PKD domain-containing protein [Neobacillus sp. WH10]WHY77212.1 PKD domain-containing protein [Neobacillus sp. WH10]
MKRMIASLLIFQVFLFYLVGGIPISTAYAEEEYYQFLLWSEGGDSFTTFGPNEEIRIHTGSVRFMKGCSEDGADDFIEPFADIYVVPSGHGLPGEELEDVSGSPNTVMAAHGGLFISEVIGYTAPGGKIGPGKYTVVYDECQDGKVSPEDKVFQDAFEVIFPTDIPDIMADPAIAEIKGKARDAQTYWEEIWVAYDMLFDIQSKLGTVGKVWQCEGLKDGIIWFTASMNLTFICPKLGGDSYPKIPNPADIQHGAALDSFFSGLTMGVEWATGVNPKQLAIKQILSTASHYRGIANDPPNPDFQKITPLASREVIETESNNPETLAITSIGNELGNEAPLLEAFLTSIERYQGSTLEKNGDWSLIHARAAQQYAKELKKQVTRTNTAIDYAKTVLEKDPSELNKLAEELQAFRDEVAANGFPADFVRELKNLGYTNSQIEELKSSLIKKSYSFDKAEVLGKLDSLINTNKGLITSFDKLATNLQENWIPYLTAMPSVHDLAPIADAGESYSGSEGSQIMFDGSHSKSPSSIVKYEWDLDGDGAFDDASGAKPTFTYDRNVNKLIGLKVTNEEGWSNIDYASVFIENSNKAPRVTSLAPDREGVEVIANETKVFSIEAEDLESEEVKIEWYIDRVHAGSGKIYSYTPSNDKVGKHVIEAIITDSEQPWEHEVISWPVLVLLPDNDGDKWRANVDCEDNDAQVNPGASEIYGNGKDDDCNPETSDISKPPKAAFYPGGDGKNVAFSLSGAKVEAASSQYDYYHAPQQLLDIGNIYGLPWSTRTNENQWVIISLEGGKTFLIDRVQVMPRYYYQHQRVKDFEVAVSTTTLDHDAFTTVLKATADDNGNVQEFKLQKPVPAKYVMYRPLNSQGGGEYISTQQFRVKTPQISVPTVTFENQSTDPENDIVSWEWDFGDGSPISTEKNPTHTFPDSGTYSVTLKAIDANGNMDAYTMEQTIQPVDFEFLPKNPKEGEQVTFYNNSIGADNGQLTAREWNFGDGSPATSASSETHRHTFKDNGTFSVSLEITDKNGKKYKGHKDITPVNVTPTVDAGVDMVVRSNQKVNFSPYITDPGADSKSCFWDFGDGTTSDVCNPDHTYPLLANGAPDKTYSAKVTVTDDDGGTSIDSRSITVRADRDPAIVAYFTFENDFKDHSGNNNNGSPVGNMTFVDGIQGKAAKFDGHSGIDVKDSESLDLSTSLSFSMWVYKEDAGAGGWAKILTKGDTSDYGPYALLHTPDGSTPGVRFTDGLTNRPDHMFSTAATKMKEWYMYTVTWDGSTIRYYVNEQPVGTTPWTGVFQNSSSKLLIGYDPPGVMEYFRGYMDNLRIYNYPLSQQQISELYQNDQQPADQVPPETKAQVDPPAPTGKNSWYTENVSITLAGTDDASGIDRIEYRLDDGEWKIYSTPITVDTDGDYTIDYRSIDKAGNKENYKTVSVKVDKAKPITTAERRTWPNGENGWYLEATSIILRAFDTGSGIEKTEYRINDSEWKEYTDVIAVTGEGINKIEYRSIDAAGNVGEAKAVEVKLDQTKPVTSATINPTVPTGTNSWYTEPVQVTLHASDNESGVAETKYRINGGEWQKYTGELLISTDGKYIIEFSSTDLSGNTEEAKSVDVYLDQTKPSTLATVDPSSASGENGWYTKMLTITLTATDEGSGAWKTEYRIDDGDWSLYTTPIQLTEEGSHIVEYRSIDKAGNVEDLKSLQVNIDKTAPELTIKLSDNTLWPPNHKMVTVKVIPEVMDTGSGVQNISLTSITCNESDDETGDGQTTDDIQNAEYGTADFEFDLRAERSGKGTGRIYTITYTITDMAGNSRIVSTTLAVGHDQSSEM